MGTLGVATLLLLAGCTVAIQAVERFPDSAERCEILGASRCGTPTEVAKCLDGYWSAVETCTAGRFCDRGACVEVRECTTPGQVSCAGSYILVCIGDEWKPDRNCSATGEHCVDGACVSGAGGGEGEGEGDGPACPPDVPWSPTSTLWVASEAGLSGWTADGGLSRHSELPPPQQGSSPRAIAVGPDGVRVVGIDEETATLRTVDGATGSWEPGGVALTDLPQAVSVRSLALSYDGAQAAAIVEGEGGAFWVAADLRSRQRVDLDPELGGVQNGALGDPDHDAVVLTRTGRVLLGGGGSDVVIDATDPATPIEIRATEGEGADAPTIRHDRIAVTPDGRWLFGARGLSVVRLDLATHPTGGPAESVVARSGDLDSGAEVSALVAAPGGVAYVAGVYERAQVGPAHVPAVLVVGFEAAPEPTRLAAAEVAPAGERDDVAAPLLAPRAGGAGVVLAFGAQLRSLPAGADAALGEPVDAGADVTALAAVTDAHGETCNGFDDDCDGRVDEDFGAGEDCESVGECGAGQVECAGRFETVCDVGPGGTRSRVVAPDDDCDGLDDDCDGRADEDAVPGAGEPEEVDAFPSDKRHTAVAWDPVGERLAVAWTDLRFAGDRDSEVLLTVTGEDGYHRNASADEVPSERPHLAWNGVLGFSLLWHTGARAPEGRPLGMVAFDASGDPWEPGVVSPSGAATSPAGLVASAGWLVYFEDQGQEGRLRRVDGEGTVVAGGRSYAAAHSVSIRGYGDVVAVPGGFRVAAMYTFRGVVGLKVDDVDAALAATVSRETFQLQAEGVPISAPRIAYAAGGDVTGVALWGGEDGDGRKPLRFRRALVGPVHEVLGTTRSSSTFDLSADATRFAAVWDDVDGISAAVFVAGEPLPEPAVIVDSPGTALYPTVVSDGSGFRVAYIDGPVGAQKVYFVRVRDACAADEG